jgi:hypothetical protein
VTQGGHDRHDPGLLGGHLLRLSDQLGLIHIRWRVIVGVD